MKKIIIAVLLIAVMACSVFAFAGCTSADYTVGIVQHIQHVALNKSNEGFQDRLTQLFEEDGKTVKFLYRNASGETTNNTTAAQTLITQRVDLIFAIATPSAQAVVAETNTLPIVFSAVTSAKDASLTADNIAGTTDLNDVKKQVDLMVELVPNAKKIAVLYSTDEPNSTIQRDMVRDYAESKKLGFAERGISTIDDVANALNAFKRDGVDCVYIPTDNKLAAAADSVHAFNKDGANLPIVCGENEMNNKCGIATYGVDYYAIGARAAEMAYDILTGKKTPKEIGYEDPQNFELSINQTVAREIGFTIPQSVLDKVAK